MKDLNKLNLKSLNELHLELTGSKLPAKTKKSDAVALIEAAQNANKPARQKQAVSQKASMSISDRRVLCLDTDEIYRNCSAVWKANLISSSQCDTLSGKLLKTARQNEFPVVEIAGGKYQLAQGAGK
jgi:hypothetical protein